MYTHIFIYILHICIFAQPCACVRMSCKCFPLRVLCRAYPLKSTTFHVMGFLLQRFEDLSEEIQKIVEAPTLCVC